MNGTTRDNEHDRPARSSSRNPLRPGIYSPVMTFFDADTEDVDVATCRSHAVRLCQAGLQGIVVMGSNGEAVHLNQDEKALITRETRAAMDEAGFSHVPVLFGASEASVRGTIELCRTLAHEGGEYALVLSPSYYRYAMDDDAIYEYFIAVATGSPVPIVIYNYPGAVAGIDLDSDFLIKLAKHPNIVGTKFTCGNNGKLTRVALGTDAVTSACVGSGYMAFGGMADFTAQTAASGGSGIIAGGANVMPKTCVRVWDLWAEGKSQEALELQKLLSRADWVLTKSAIPGTKSAIQSFFGYGGFPRRPLKRLSDDKARAIAEDICELMEIEKGL